MDNITKLRNLTQIAGMRELIGDLGIEVLEEIVSKYEQIQAENERKAKEIMRLETIRRRQAKENERLKELARLREDLLVCYRVNKQPSGELLDRLHILGNLCKL